MARMEWVPRENYWVKRCVSCDFDFKVEAGSFHDARVELSKFFALGNTYDGLNSWCRSCKSAYSSNRDDDVKRDDLLHEQAGACALCKKEISFVDRTAVIDHCYAIKKVRGILCLKCNQRMAAVDDEEWLAEAIAYRNKFRCV